ncbi:D-alanyl-D-alanine carboxypeptidase/D-alanyl-D-alanine-endopeptidase [Hyphomonas sp.]|uniref:D-alanyl-D-alanine carboxypeptidase/D-alanyl-D-alanine endopeptidase n=1 Tax=Hyphomonas sp. TaxID=87 RepID=UPI00356752D2
MQTTFRAILLVACLLVAACVSPLQRDLETILQPPELQGVRWGLLVTDMQGHEIVALDPDQRFLPASNTKLFTTAAVFRWQDELDAMLPRLGTFIALEDVGETDAPVLVLHGRGDPALSDTPDCETRCLATLADAVAGIGLTTIAHVIGDDTWFRDQRWGPGWSWDDLQTRYGTAISALTVNNNTVTLTITPAATEGAPADVAWAPGDAAYTILNDTVTAPRPQLDTDNAGEAAQDDLRVSHLPGTASVRVSGHVSPGSGPRRVPLGLDDPALAAATRLGALLAARGVTVEGPPVSRHRPPGAAPQAALTALDDGDKPLAALAPPAFADALVAVSKDSRNLQAELLLRHLGHISEDGSAEAGLGRVAALLEEAGASPNGYDLFDGSGMSVYNRVSPRTIVRLLIYAATQDWGEDWKDTFPVGGTDGSLKRRFRGTILDGNIFAKTGTLKGTNALSGYMTAASGQTLVFAVIANERPLAVSSSAPMMDAALVRIAEGN